MKDAVDDDFVKALPKVELHAHLSGSISPNTLHEIWLARKKSEPDFPLDDPLVAMAPDRTEFDVMRFFPLFDNYIYSLLTTPPAVTYAVRSVLRDFLADGVRYIELRTTPRTSATMTAEEYVQTVLHALADWHASQDAQPPEDEAHPRLHAKLILSLDRRMTEAQAQTTIDLAIQHRADGVVGVDLCGHPHRPIDPSILGPAFRRARGAGLAVTVHFAETPRSASAEELAFLLGEDVGARRLGHVCRVPDELRDRIIEEGRGVELCLSCNVLAKLTDGGFPGHHFKDWWEAGWDEQRDTSGKKRARVALCTDDVGVFRSPQSNEFLLASQHFGHTSAEGKWRPLSRLDCWQICHDACGIIFGSDDERVRIEGILEEFRKRTS